MNLEQLLGDEADSLLNHEAKAFGAEHLTLPGPDHLDNVFVDSDRSTTVLRNLGTLYSTGRLSGTGYLSILPVDQGIEHSAGASFAKFPSYFDPAKLCDLAVAADCNAIATTLGGLGIVSRRYAHKIPFIVKLNHNDFLNYPNTYEQVMFAGVGQASDLGAVGVGATVYFGSEGADRQIVEVSRAFAEAHRLGMFTVLWCYLRNPAFKQGDTDYHVSADLTGQANHLGVTIEADIIKQKQPENNGGYNALKFGKVGLAELEGVVAAVVLGLLLLDDVGLDGHPEVVGLAGQVRRHVVVGVGLLEGRVAEVAPEHGEHAQPVRLLEGTRHLDDLAVRMLRSEVDAV